MKRRDYWQLERIIKTSCLLLLSDINSAFNNWTPSPVSGGTIQYIFGKQNHQRRFVEQKCVIKAIDRKRGLLWCVGKRKYVTENWKRLIVSNKTKIIISHDEMVCICIKKP